MSALLNPAQREAVRYVDGPLLVLAGAGSGKTRVITHKIAYLIEECGVSAHKIAAITFTNKAAREMRERTAALLKGGGASKVTLCTFHALGAILLRKEASVIQLKPNFSILDAADAAALIQELVKDADKAVVRRIQQRISAWKNALITADAALRCAEDELQLHAARVYADYERALRAYQAVDFDDLIGLPVRLLSEHEEVALRWQQRIGHLLVDEYQDTNHSQYRLLRLLSGVRAAFTAVGDDDQAIYGWRGADVANLAQLGADYRNLRIIKLTQNYRSTTRILAAANSVISHNPKLFDKRLWSDKGHGDVINIHTCRDPEQEAEWVIARLLAHKFSQRGRFGDYAILYRGNHQARLFEQQLRTHKAPYLLSGGQSFFERSEIKDLVSYLRLLANDDDDPAFIRAITCPKRGIGGATLEALGRASGRRHCSLFAAAYAAGIENEVPLKALALVREFCEFINRMNWRATREPAGQVLADLIRAIDYEQWLFETLEPREAEGKIANVRDFTAWLTRKGEADDKNLVELAQTIALITLLDKGEENPDAVQLATLHAAKGLEFRHVFLVGVEEGLLPHREAIDLNRIDEERRLMYVGITRAQMSLTLTWCARRKQGGEMIGRDPSRFIEEMGDDIRHLGKDTEPTEASRAKGRAVLSRYKELLAAKTG